MARSTKDTPTPRDPERTRGRLLKTGIRLFAAKGFHGVSVDEIVAAAKVNKRMVYHYFGSKEALYLEALSVVFDRIAEPEMGAMSGQAAPDEKLRLLLAGYFEFLDANPEFVRMLLWENLDGGRHITANPGRLSKNPFVMQFGSIIEEGVAAKIFRAPRDTRHLLINLIGICFIYHSNRHSLAVSIGVGDDAKERRARLEQACDLVLHGLRTRS